MSPWCYVQYDKHTRTFRYEYCTDFGDVTNSAIAIAETYNLWGNVHHQMVVVFDEYHEIEKNTFLSIKKLDYNESKIDDDPDIDGTNYWSEMVGPFPEKKN